MATNALVGVDLSEGAKVVSTLENHGIHVRVALWMVTPQFEDGRLVIASEDLPQTDILSDYEKVLEILRESFTSELPLFSILPLDDDLVRDLRRRFAGTVSLAGRRVGGETIGNRYIDDGYIYKIA